MSTRGTIVIKDDRIAQEAYLYQHSGAYPEGMAETLREALEAVRTEPIDLMAAVLPNGRPYSDQLELDQKPHWHGDTAYRYDITQTSQGVRVVVSDIALDLSRPEDVSVLGYEFLKDEHRNWVYVPIFEGSLEEFFSWSKTFDKDSDNAMQKLVEASRKVQGGV